MNVKFIGASAGSGKTHRITEELYTQLSAEKARPDAIIATTFTVKAANELVERVRLKLLKEGKYEFAHAINQSLINTVNSVCQSLLERFAFTAGISPKLEVLDENDAPILFARSLDDVLDKETLTALSHLQRKLGIENKHEGIDWTREVKRIVDLSRANGIKPEKFADQAKSSAESLLSHFPKASKTSPTKDLIAAIETAQKEIAAIDDATKSTKSYLTDISKFRASLVHGYDSWSDWVKFSKAKPAKKSIAASESIREIAAKYDSHPDLHDDLNTWIGIVFEVAGKALEAYR